MDDFFKPPLIKTLLPLLVADELMKHAQEWYRNSAMPPTEVKENTMDERTWLTSTEPQAMLFHLETIKKLDERKLWHFVRACREVVLASFRHRKKTIINFTDDGNVQVKAREWASRDQYPDYLPFSLRCDFIRDIWGNPFREIQLPYDYVGDPDLYPITWREPRTSDNLKRKGLLVCPWFAWNNGTVRTLAQAVLDERQQNGTLDPVRLAVLCDALQEAGCEDETILNHLRGMVQVQCEHCEGKGLKKIRKQKLYPEHIKAFVPEFEVVDEWCTDCAGSGFIWTMPRKPASHWNGCWVIDLLIQRE